MRFAIRGHSMAVVPLLFLSVVLAGCGSASVGAQHASGSTQTTRQPSKSTVAAPIHEVTSFKEAGCPSNSAISQGMNGAVTACLRAGAIAPGRYSIAILAVQQPKGSAAASQGLPVPSGAQAGPTVSLTLSPRSGPPGSVVSLKGTILAPLQRKPDHIQVCWDGCETGLSYSGVPITWLSPTSFTGSIVVPGAPWFRSGADKVTPLESAEYKVSVECLTLVKGCGLGGSEGSAPFELNVGSGGASWCPSTTACATLTAAQGMAYPGDVVKIQGFAPLQSIISSNQPFQFELKVTPGPAPADEITFVPSSKGGGQILIGHAALDIKAPPSYSSLGKLAPGNPVSAGAGPISENPANPGEIIWCNRDKIAISGPDGNRAISTASVAKELASLGYELAGGSSPSCSSVALADGGTVGKIVVASFLAASTKGAPPFFTVALETLDGGKSWKLLPVPRGARSTGFGGFRYFDSSVQALFAPNVSNASSAGSLQASPLVETLKSGGASWAPGKFQCPSQGPCVTFGAYVPGNCAMNGSTQSIVYSSDSGSTWSEASWPAQVQACWSSELVPVSARAEFLVDTGSQYFLRESTDGGANWRVIGIPQVPGSTPGMGITGSEGSEIQMLSNGELLASGQRGSDYSWSLLKPGSKRWCTVKGLPSGVASSSRYSRVVELGPKLYWVPANTAAGSGSSSLQSLPESDLKC